jgi:hypothetical protein
MQAVAPPRAFVRGDSNLDRSVDIADPINTLTGLFQGQGNAFTIDCPDRLDSNDDGRVDLSDAVHTLRWLFSAAAPPPAPGPAFAGHDPTFDLLICYE